MKTKNLHQPDQVVQVATDNQRLALVDERSFDCAQVGEELMRTRIPKRGV